MRGESLRIINHGAVGDGLTVNTQIIQECIDTCSRQGGGKVIIEDGVYICGGLYLKSNVTLEVTASATLLATPRIEDYGTNTHHNRYRNESDMDRCWIYAEDQENINITGSGEINGNGEAFPNSGRKERPMMFCFLPEDLGSSVELMDMPAIGTMKRLLFSNLLCTDEEEMKTPHYRFGKDIMGAPWFNGIRIDAEDNHKIEDVVLENIRYTSVGGVLKKDIPKEYPAVLDRLINPEGESSENYYPDWSRSAFMDIRNVKTLYLSNLGFQSLYKDERPAYIIENSTLLKEDVFIL